MLKYRKKSIVVEAFQMTRERRGDNSEWPTWLHQAWNKPLHTEGSVWPKNYPNSDGTDRLCIGTKEGVYIIAWDDFIIKGIQGEPYPCKPDIFEVTYEKMDTWKIKLNNDECPHVVFPLRPGMTNEPYLCKHPGDNYNKECVEELCPVAASLFIEEDKSDDPES